MPFKIATWNVNSLRVRLPHVIAWLEKEQPDVLALQEIKMEAVHFPYQALLDIGYHSVVCGQKTYNGVAILTKQTIDTTDVIDYLYPEDNQRRLVAITLNNTRIVNVYIPNGAHPSDEKYQYKLKWLAQLHAFLRAQLQQYPQTIVLGDFNIAPTDNDVYDPSAWVGQVLVSEPERSAFNDILQLGFKDSFRLVVPEEKVYSWWDYRAAGFRRNLGMRIDHIVISDALVPRCDTSYIDKAPRALEKPSDHTPVVLVLSD